MDSLGVHLFHQPGPLDRIGKAGIVFDIGGDGQLSTLLHPRNQHRFQHGTRCIDRSRISGRTGAENDQFCMVMRIGRGRGHRCGFQIKCRGRISRIVNKA